MKWRNLAVLVGVVVLLVSFAYGQDPRDPIYDRDPSGTDAFGILHTEWEGDRAITSIATNLKSLDIDGNYVYAVGESLMATFSILYPLSPSLVNEYKLSGYDSLYFEDIEVRGNFAFIVGGYKDSAWYGMILVLNIGFPDSPTFVDTFIHDNSRYTAIDLEGNVAYVTDSLGNLRSFNITTLTSISVIYNLGIDPGAHDLVVDGNIAYVSFPIQIQSFNVTNPSISFITRSPSYSWVRDIYVDGDWLFAATIVGVDSFGLRKFSIENAIVDSSSEYWWDYGTSYGVTVMGNWAYTVGYYSNGGTTYATIRGYDVTGAVDTVSKINFRNEELTRMQKNGETMIYAIGKYTTTDKGMLRAIRVAYPDTNAVDSRSIEFLSINYGHLIGNSFTEPSQLEVRGNHAFVVDSQGMMVIDITYPEDSVYWVAEYWDTFHTFYGIAVSGNSAFLTSTDRYDDSRSFWIIDITDPQPPLPSRLSAIGTTAPDLHPHIVGEVKIEGNVAYTHGIDTLWDASLGRFMLRSFLDAFNIQTLSSPSWLSSDLMLCRVGVWWNYYEPFFGELQIEGDTVYISWRQNPYDPSLPASVSAINTNHIGFFDIRDPADVTAFLPIQQIIGGLDIYHNMGCFRENITWDHGGAIDAEGNVMYSTIGKEHQQKIPIWEPGSRTFSYGLIRYDVDTTYCGKVWPIVGNYEHQSDWIAEYLGLTDKNDAAPMELFVDGDYAFCSFEDDSLYFMKVDSVDVYTPQHYVIPILHTTFNDFKTHGDFLFALGDSTNVHGFKGRFWSIKVYERNHD